MAIIETRGQYGPDVELTHCDRTYLVESRLLVQVEDGAVVEVVQEYTCPDCETDFYRVVDPEKYLR